jgi:uncharacterized OsmC-like protein
VGPFSDVLRVRLPRPVMIRTADFATAESSMATETESIALTITQESDYAFRVAFDETALPPMLADESPPLGAGKGPDPARLLGAAIGNCLSASLLFALRKFKNAPGTIVARVRMEHARNERGRLRIGKVAVEITLPEAAGEYTQIERILAQFEEFCTVTESVRAGVPVEVTVKDGTGAVLRASDHVA